MINFVPQTLNFQSCIETFVGSIPIHKGDQIEAIERGDGLWNIRVNNIMKIGYAIVAEDVNKLAGTVMVGG
jgi:hypothetical protein